MLKNIDIRLLFSLLIILLLPSFYRVAFLSSSLANGMLISSVIIIIINYKLFKMKINIKIFYLFFLVFILLFLMGIYQYIVSNELKPLLSISLIIIFFSSFLLTLRIKKINYKTFLNTLFLIIILLIFIGWMKNFFMLSCCNYVSYPKAVFPFSEDSHFALTLGILAVSYSLVGSNKKAIFIILNLFILSFLIINLTLVVFSLLSLFTYLIRIKAVFFKLVVIIMPFFLITFIAMLSKIEYFSSRLTLKDTENLTSLVFLQGYELAYLNFVKTYGLGLGFQMLGSASTYQGYFSELLSKLGSKGLNLSDGGLLMSKLIAEFGLIGFLITLFFIIFIIKFIFYANKLISNPNFINLKNNDFLMKKLLLSGLVVGFSVEFFLRGYGYFSPSLFLVSISIFYLISSKKNTRKNI